MGGEKKRDPGNEIGNRRANLFIYVMKLNWCNCQLFGKFWLKITGQVRRDQTARPAVPGKMPRRIEDHNRAAEMKLALPVYF